MASLNMTDILLDAYQLADMIQESEEVARYLELKKRLQEDQEAQELIYLFQKKKELVEECQRFGHYHPDFRDAKNKARDFQKKMVAHPVIKEYLHAEEALDLLLAEVSRTIAHSVSDSIKVPVNHIRPSSRKRCG